MSSASVSVADEDEAASDGAERFTSEELAWGRKEAKSRLSAEDYRMWRKLAKKSKKGSS